MIGWEEFQTGTDCTKQQRNWIGNTMQYQYFAGYQTNLSACKLMQLFLLVSSYVATVILSSGLLPSHFPNKPLSTIS